MEVTLDKFGRILIPKPVRDLLGLKTGSRLHLETVESQNGEREIALRPAREAPVLIRKGRVLVFKGERTEGEEPLDAGSVVKAARRERIDHLARLTGS